jgi:hypothetical protein
MNILAWQAKAIPFRKQQHLSITRRSAGHLLIRKEEVGFEQGSCFLGSICERKKMTPMVSMPSCYAGHKSLMDFPKDVTTSNRQHRLGIHRVQRQLCFNPSYIPLSGDFVQPALRL